MSSQVKVPTLYGGFNLQDQPVNQRAGYNQPTNEVSNKNGK